MRFLVYARAFYVMFKVYHNVFIRQEKTLESLFRKNEERWKKHASLKVSTVNFFISGRLQDAVKTELCNFCLKSGILCSKCQGKLKSGNVTEMDFSIARLLLSLEEKYTSLQEVTFHKAVQADRILAILVNKGDVPRLLSHGGKIVKALSEKTGKTIRVLEFGVTERKFLEDLFVPLSILTINKIWLPDGTTETRVILNRGRRKRIPNVKAAKELAKKLRGMTLRVEFAR
jgi:transcription antitermination factor NusA-like protein